MKYYYFASIDGRWTSNHLLFENIDSLAYEYGLILNKGGFSKNKHLWWTYEKKPLLIERVPKFLIDDLLMPWLCGEDEIFDVSHYSDKYFQILFNKWTRLIKLEKEKRMNLFKKKPKPKPKGKKGC